MKTWLVLLTSIATTSSALAVTGVVNHSKGCVDISKAGLELQESGATNHLFQALWDTRQKFELQVHEFHPSGEPQLTRIFYVAVHRRFLGQRHVVGVNPVLVTQPGHHLDFTLRNCLTEADLPALQTLVSLPAPTDGGIAGQQTGTNAALQYVPLEVRRPMLPSGETNVHTHGLHAPPTFGQEGRPSGDEVLQAFVDLGQSSTGPLGKNSVRYRMDIPTTQHPGLYWYHPHFHGEAQQ